MTNFNDIKTEAYHTAKSVSEVPIREARNAAAEQDRSARELVIVYNALIGQHLKTHGTVARAEELQLKVNEAIGPATTAYDELAQGSQNEGLIRGAAAIKEAGAATASNDERQQAMARHMNRINDAMESLHLGMTALAALLEDPASAPHNAVSPYAEAEENLRDFRRGL